MIWLDAYGPGNGATAIVPGSHKHGDEHGGAVSDSGAEPRVLSGAAGDILIFDPEVLHGATTNYEGTPRRSLLVSYADVALREGHRKTEALRGVRMDTGEVFG